MTIAATFSGAKSRVTKEQLAIRSKLQLRHNTTTNTWEVYTTILGSKHNPPVFKWALIEEELANWYLRTFPEIQVVEVEMEL